MSQILSTHFSQAAMREGTPSRLTIDESTVAKWDDAFKGEQKLSESCRGDSEKQRVVSQMLEYEYEAIGGDQNMNVCMNESMLDEAAANSPAGVDNADNYDPILMKLVRKVAPSLIHHDLVGVQPMTGPTGLIFAMKSYYVNQDGSKTEAYPEGVSDGSNAPRAGHTAGFKTMTSDNVNDRASNMYSVQQLEKLGTKELAAPSGGKQAVQIDPATIWPEMTFTIERQSVSAEARALKARYTDELVQDLRAIHGLSARDELVSIMGTEMTAEKNRELVLLLANQAKPGCQNTAVAGQFNLDVDADGRWAIEKFKGLLLQINREAHVIAIETRRGVGNTIIAHSDVVAALDMAGVIDKSIVTGNLQADGVGVTFAGTLSGRFKVFVDPYASTHYVLVGFKGSNRYDAGVFYCPYVAAQFMEARDGDSFQPAMGIKERYGMAVNPMVAQNDGTGVLQGKGANPYYRIFTIVGL